MMATQLPTAVPVPPAAVSRVLARFDRRQLAGFISVAIDLLDTLDGPSDPDTPDFAPRSDALPGDPDDAEPAGDEQGDISWTEWHTRGRRKVAANGSEDRHRLGGCTTPGEDDEDDDPREANGDEHDTGNADDEELTGASLWAGDGPGCPISDPGGCTSGGDAVGRCPTYGIDQRHEVSEGEAFHDLNGIPANPGASAGERPMSAAKQWFLLDQQGDQVLILSPEGRFVVGRMVGRIGNPRPARKEARS